MGGNHKVYIGPYRLDTSHVTGESAVLDVDLLTGEAAKAAGEPLDWSDEFYAYWCIK